MPWKCLLCWVCQPLTTAFCVKRKAPFQIGRVRTLRRFRGAESSSYLQSSVSESQWILIKSQCSIPAMLPNWMTVAVKDFRTALPEIKANSHVTILHATSAPLCRPIQGNVFDMMLPLDRVSLPSRWDTRTSHHGVCGLRCMSPNGLEQTVCCLQATCSSKFDICICHIKHITSKNIRMFMMKLIGSKICCGWTHIFYKISCRWAWDFFLQTRSFRSAARLVNDSKLLPNLASFHSMGSMASSPWFSGEVRLFVPSER